MLEEDADDVGGGDPLEQFGRRDRGQDVDLALVLRELGRGAELRLERAVAHDHEHAARDLARSAAISCSTPRPTENPPW